MMSGRSASSASLFTSRIHHPLLRNCSARPVFSIRATGDVLVTREEGKNTALINYLSDLGIPSFELPLIAAVPGPDVEKLPDLLRNQTFDYVVLTSPEAASVFLRGWRHAGSPQVTIAAVGKGTTRVLNDAAEAASLQADFMPSKANAEHLSVELPFVPGGNQRVLYPASQKAQTTLQVGLKARGFDVCRLNTYNSVAVTASDVAQDVLDRAKECAVVSVASPSALAAWIGLVGLDFAKAKPVACIGSTSGRAGLKAGLNSDLVFWDEDPGMDGFVRSIESALDSCRVAQ